MKHANTRTQKKRQYNPITDLKIKKKLSLSE